MPVIVGYSSSDDDMGSSESVEVVNTKKSGSKGEISTGFQEPLLIPKNKLYVDETTFKLGKRAIGTTAHVKQKKRKKGNPEDDDFSGPWAKFESSEEEQYSEPEEQEQEESEAIKPKTNVQAPDTTESIPTSELIDSETSYYHGRSYMKIPNDVPVNLKKAPGHQHCFVPKKIIHTYNGHSRGVTKLETYRHLLLSGGNDSKIKLWDLYHGRELLRVFTGHNQAVKDLCFNSTGTQFLSSGFDRKVLVWNTETGELEKTIKVDGIPNVVKYNPNNESEILVGLSNKKINHYDLSREDFQSPIQTYDHHLGAINSITIIENNKRFMTTSDDKSVRFWDWQINIPRKIISDPSQHSMPTAIVYPGGNYIALQSMDNSIHVIQGNGKYKSMKKKSFSGHQVAGYGIDIDISPDGKIIMSGDANGFGYFWDWKTCKLINKLKVNNKPITCIRFLPHETSKVLLAGTSGEIYYCD